MISPSADTLAGLTVPPVRANRTSVGPPALTRPTSPGASLWQELWGNLASTPSGAPASRLGPALPAAEGEKKISVHCHYCGTEHNCFDHAPATSCPGCGRTISLQDVIISTPSCRSVDTRGHLRIERTGNLYSPLTVCGQGLILGMISGELHCEGKLTLQMHGLLPVKIEAEELFIPASAEVECPFPLRVARLVVRGTLRAPVLVRQELYIQRRGRCEGAVRARAVRVDRGGELLGEVRIGPEEAPQSGQPTARETFCNLRSALHGRFRRRRPVY